MKIHLWLAVALSAVLLTSLSPARATSDSLWQLQLKDGRPTNCRLAYTKLARDEHGAMCLIADTSTTKNTWNGCVQIPQGLFKAGQDYVVSFDYQILDRPNEKSYFYVFARSGQLGNNADMWSKWHDSTGSRGARAAASFSSS